MKILYLTARQPYPVIKGDQIIAYEQIKELSKNNDIYLVSLFDNNYKELKEEMGKYCKGLYFYKHTKVSKFISMLKTAYNFKSLQANCFYRLDVEKQIKKIYKEICPDVVHVQSFRMAEYFLKVNVNKSIDLIDAYSLNMKKRADKSKVLKPLWLLEYSLLKNYEQVVLRNYKAKTIVSNRDKEYLNDEAIIVNPNGTSFNYEKTELSNEINNDIIFHGNMSYYPNVEAVEYIVNNIFSEIKKIDNKCRMHIVGGNPSEKIRSYAKSNDVIVTGYVKDMQEYLKKCKVAIYPIFSATGMQNKVLEAMGAGVPCIVSKQCENGIRGLKHGENVLIAENKKDYINFYKELIENENFYNKIRENAYKFVIENYSWKKNCDILEGLWKLYRR